MHDIFMEVSKDNIDNTVPSVLITTQQEAQDFPIWLSPLKSNKSPFDVGITHSVEHWRSLAGSPFDSSDSDSSSECDDDTMSLDSSDLTMREAPFSGDVSLISEGIGTLNIMPSNALGLVFISMEDVLETKAIATSTPQAESLRAPTNHQDDPSCGRPTQKHYAQREHVAFQLDGPTEDTLVDRFPQDIGMWEDVGDDIGPKVSKARQRSHSG